ncbi:alpha/beta-hydrolase [Cryphonectria parasitica EP155]|uniref:Alpha/beta-hydrolase n=1 Tax=Cryphonectria parasitica (strain ATCC 38755 / EP155) TaxID=660469 RepID=A0A9P5CVM6_CRYP1|nr:alpha/beta-hydrolase [Cryphonectria parasitica EP155]KAF3770795.1 alpha/beta-hydrolase [Cryphonectria parasitica EP155]
MANTREMFYVGGRYVHHGARGQLMQGQMYVEHLKPLSGTGQQQEQPYPVVFIHGGTRTGADWLTKPDGNPGWADYFLSRGYEIYLVDVPYRGRSPWNPSVEDVITFAAETIQERFTACAQHGTWPQAKLHTQWPGSGLQGDPVFDRFFASGVQMIRSQEKQELASQAALAELLDRIGRPVLFLSHSNGGGTPYLVADVRPRLVKLIVSVEPKGPPFGGIGMLPGAGSQYGVCQTPITYEPPVVDPKKDLVKITRSAASPALRDAILQADSPPPRKLVNLTHIPVLVVTGQASYHAEYDWCTVEYLRQAGVETEHLQLAERGILGNGHMMFMEKNSDEIASEIDRWIAQTLVRLSVDKT